MELTDHDSLNAVYEMVAILKKDQEFSDQNLFDLPDYLGTVKVETLEGKGRGVVATEDILPGQLIMAAKAVAILFSNDKDGCKDKIGQLSEKVLNVIDDSEMARRVLNLYAGPEHGWLEMGTKDGADVARIEGICALNGFETDSRSELNETCFGLWYFPSFLNHACYGSNAQWRIFKNLMLIRATKLIPGGREVLITYFDPNQVYSERQNLFLKHEFQCDCLFCDIEDSEGWEVRDTRDTILSRFTENSGEKNKNLILAVIDELEMLRPQYPELNIFLIQPLLQLGLVYYNEAEWRSASQTFVKVNELCKYSAQLSLLGLSCAVAIATCCYRLNESRELIQEWIDVSKRCALVEYGTESILEYLRPAFVNEMKNAGYL